LLQCLQQLLQQLQQLLLPHKVQQLRQQQQCLRLL
jgi:hypothetical protein